MENLRWKISKTWLGYPKIVQKSEFNCTTSILHNACYLLYSDFYDVERSFQLIALLAQSFLRATAATAVARLSHRNSVRPSVCLSHGWFSQKRCKLGSTKSSLSAAWKTLVSESVKLFHKFERSHPKRGR